MFHFARARSTGNRATGQVRSSGLGADFDQHTAGRFAVEYRGRYPAARQRLKIAGVEPGLDQLTVFGLDRFGPIDEEADMEAIGILALPAFAAAHQIEGEVVG